MLKSVENQVTKRDETKRIYVLYKKSFIMKGVKDYVEKRRKISKMK